MFEYEGNFLLRNERDQSPGKTEVSTLMDGYISCFFFEFKMGSVYLQNAF